MGPGAGRAPGALAAAFPAWRVDSLDEVWWYTGGLDEVCLEPAAGGVSRTSTRPMLNHLLLLIILLRSSV